MIKTVSVGLVGDSKINYITFNLHNNHDIEQFYDDLAAYIISKYNDYFLKLIINRNYGYFDQKDKIFIYKSAKKTFSNIYLVEKDNRKLIRSELNNYFTIENTCNIYLEGFVLFRLGKYMEKLEILIDRVVDDYFVKMEYENFIMMLKEFVVLQAPSIRLVHIFLKSDKRYSVCNENFEEFSQSQLLGMSLENESDIINEDDFLLSALINMAPQKIIIHQVRKIKNKQLLETLQKIFERRLTMCNGCKICDIDIIN
ncbi:MAG: hypothetical protein E7410_04790 [Ruminococcaceae bacterium]|nr:hypothetical protein [Oscillospiraceae bacterium]